MHIVCSTRGFGRVCIDFGLLHKMHIMYTDFSSVCIDFALLHKMHIMYSALEDSVH